MKKNLNLFLFAFGLLGINLFAEARDWAFLNYQNGTCDVGSLSPAAMDEYLRKQGMIPTIEKINNDKNQLEQVDVNFKQLNGDGITLRFFTTNDACAIFRLKEIKNGNIVEKDDLR